MKKQPQASRVSDSEVKELVAAITTNAGSDDERLRGFLGAIRRNVAVPCDGFVIGEPICVIGFDYDGNVRRGLTARCRRDDGSEHIVAVSELTVAPHSRGLVYVAAYRSWLGLDPVPLQAVGPSRRQRQHKVTTTDLDLQQPIELVILSAKERVARCKLLGSDRVITLRAQRLWDAVPGEIALVRPHKQWSYAGHPYLSGELESTRLDIEALELVPLKLQGWGTWIPEQEYWGEEGEPIEDWAKPIIAHGPRPIFEMEQVVPGQDPEDFDADPICESNDLKDGGDRDGAREILMELCQADLRCLDAHAHLGNLVFERSPKDAIRHYHVGVQIGELSLGPKFDGLLPWSHIDNRPFLRCMQGYGLCLWRLSQFEQAMRIFDRMLWLNPTDNQGVRFLIADVQGRVTWEEREEPN